jgi:5,6-dimethylbenzimidazole synthase
MMKGAAMDLFTAIKERRSCRAFLPEPVSEEAIGKILEAAVWAPSPMNAQPWEFIVITSPDVKQSLYSEAEARRKWLLEKSGWKWLGRYQVDFLLTVPAIIAVIGNPDKTGADRFLEGGGLGYQHACAAAVQNMLLMAQALELGSLWFTLFDVDAMRAILSVDAAKVPLALVCIGKPDGKPLAAGRKDTLEKTTFMR